ncbi:MAG TPA: glycosyltransferase family 39 protein [Candidatus Binatia bacterium]|nr:glycosyltransferase family 39 protein [Candidatus Binatia bacterium]
MYTTSVAASPQRRADAARSGFLARNRVVLCYACLVVVTLLFASIRYRLRTMPLERDEGEYAYAGQLMLEGIPPYRLAYNMKLPGTYAAYAVILACFGQNPTGIHLGMIFVNAGETLLIFLLARRLFGWLAAIVSAAAYALVSTSPSVLGLAGHATHFVVLAATAGVLVMLYAVEVESRWLVFCSGVLFGLAFLMKQPGIMFLVFAAVWLVRVKWNVPWEDRLRSLFLLLAGGILPFAVTCALLWKFGVFQKFWFWTFVYAVKYASVVPLSKVGLVFWSVFPDVIQPALLLWVLAAAGLTAFSWCAAARKNAFLLTTLLIFSVIAVSLGSRFRPHYFILILPAVSLLAGAAVHYMTLKLAAGAPSKALQALPACMFVMIFAYGIYQQRAALFEMSPYALTRQTYGSNPFPEAVTVGQYLREHSPASARVVVMGSEPEIYFYAHRHSATGYIYTYPLLEEQKYASGMQEEMANEVEAARPEFLVLVMVDSSWFEHAPQPTLLLPWSKSYISDYYEEMQKVSIPNPEEQGVPEEFQSGPHWSIHIFRRKAS